jgi:multidrug efflux system membrane fusion protein
MGQPNRTDLQPPPEVSPPGDLPLPPDGGPWDLEPTRPRVSRTSPPGRRPRRRGSFWLAMAAFLAASYLLYRYFSSAKTAPAPAKNAPPPAAITAGRATLGDMNIYIQALGTVTPVHTVTVYTQVTGTVIGVYYREGQTVNQGDSLIDIDPRPFQANLMQAEGNLQHDQGLLAQAKMDLARYQAAFALNAIAKQTLDDQEHLVAQLEGTVKADQGAVDFARTQLSYCHIVAPIGGRVGLRLVDPGNVVFAGAQSTLLVITQLQPITVVFTVPEDDLTRVQGQSRGQHSLPVDAFDRSNEKKIESGTFGWLDNQVDTTTGTVKFRASFPNSRLQLFPNQFVNTRLLVRTLHKATLVPSVAVQHNGAATFVYAVQPDKTVAVRNVNVVSGNEQESAVTGLSPGAEVATSGFDRLENGVAVTIRAQTELSAKAAPKRPAHKGQASRKAASDPKQ